MGLNLTLFLVKCILFGKVVLTVYVLFAAENLYRARNIHTYAAVKI